MPLTVREAGRLEARSGLFSCKLMMEEQDRKDMGCCLDEYANEMQLATPEDLFHSMHTIASTVGSSTSGMIGVSHDSGFISRSTIATLNSNSSSRQAPFKEAGLAGGTDSTTLSEQQQHPPIASMPQRTLRMKKRRSDFFTRTRPPPLLCK